MMKAQPHSPQRAARSAVRVGLDVDLRPSPEQFLAYDRVALHGGRVKWGEFVVPTGPRVCPDGWAKQEASTLPDAAAYAQCVISPMRSASLLQLRVPPPAANSARFRLGLRVLTRSKAGDVHVVRAGEKLSVGVQEPCLEIGCARRQAQGERNNLVGRGDRYGPIELGHLEPRI